VFNKSGSSGLSLEGTCSVLLFFFSFSLSYLPHIHFLSKCKVRYINWYRSLGYHLGQASIIQTHTQTQNPQITLNHPSISPLHAPYCA